jgi:fatty-acyl-CoA synthase
VFYPLTVMDFLDRATTVYPDRVAVVDEPDQPAPSWGEITYAELGRRARRPAPPARRASRSCRTTRPAC